MIRDFIRAIVIWLALLLVYADATKHDEAVLNQISTTKETR